MNLISKFPIHIDYVIGILMILSGFYQLYIYLSILIEYPGGLGYVIFELLPKIILVAGGVLVMLLPRKNLRRTIWLCSVLVGLNMLALGYAEYRSYSTIMEYLEPAFGSDDYYMCLRILTLVILHIGSAVAMIVNGLFFASKRTRTIYPIIIAIVLGIIADYFQFRMNYGYDLAVTDILRDLVANYISHMLLLGFFTLVFTSGEVSWYTAKGDVNRAINRLCTVNSIFSVYTVTRAQLFVLMQSEYECTMRLRQGKFVCCLEVGNDENGRHLTFCRNGAASRSAAFYLEPAKVCLPGTMSDSQYADIYGTAGMHVRLKIVEPRKRHANKKVKKSQMERNVLPLFAFCVPNSFLYHLNDDTAECLIGKGKEPESPRRLVISGTGDDRKAEVFRTDGRLFCRSSLRAAVPLREYGAYTKLYLYGDFGKYMAFKVKLPKRNQEEKPDTEERRA